MKRIAILALLLLSSTARADEAQLEAPKPKLEAPKKENWFIRAGAGYERGQLFLGSSNPRPRHGIPLILMVGRRDLEHFAASGEFLFTPGASDHGISMSRVVLGASAELRLGPMFFSLGPHAVWFGAWRKSSGRSYNGFLDEGSLLWRLGVGGHAMLGVDLTVAKQFGVFAGVRGDIDALMGSNKGDSGESHIDVATNGSVLGVVGVSFR